LPAWEKFLAEHDKNKDGVIPLAEFDENTREYYRGYDASRDGKIDRSDWDLILADLAKSENVMVAVKPGGRGNISQTHVAWKATRGLPYISSPLYYDGRVYLFKNGGMMSSFDAKTGQPYYLQERLGAEGYYYSSPVAADGRIYIASQAGKVTVVKAGGDKPEILHQADFGEHIYASPALVGDKLYLRTRSQLYAFGSQSGHAPAQP
jgi:outer membrane protein assembly factor BamB